MTNSNIDFAVYQKALAAEKDVSKLLAMRDSLNTVIRAGNALAHERVDSQKSLRAVLDQLVAVGHGAEVAPKIPEIPKPPAELLGNSVALRERVNELAGRLQNNVPDRGFDKTAANIELAGLWQALAQSEIADRANSFNAEKDAQRAAAEQQRIEDSVALAGTFNLSGKGAGA